MSNHSMGQRSVYGAFLALAIWLAAGVLAQSQLPTATIFGTVKDSSGAVIPGDHRSWRRG